MPSTTPNGQAPCRNPYAEDARHAPANMRMKDGERSSTA
jgi:hypothetical protein